MKIVPALSLVTFIIPLCVEIILDTNAKPRPVPFVDPETKGSNILSII